MTTVRNYSHLIPHSLEFLRIVTEFLGILVEILYCEYARTCIFDAFLCRKMTQVNFEHNSTYFSVQHVCFSVTVVAVFYCVVTHCVYILLDTVAGISYNRHVCSFFF